MFLEKIEIQGFKSFAKKTVLKFAHEDVKNKSHKTHNIGLTVIVGPNGSGKSNVADAVRWVLGEQSVKMLRGKKSEDIIFAGSAKKSSLSFSEVSIYLNNEDKNNGIDYTQLVITRRLYRDGEGEYLINNNKVRLLDIQLLLAKANFGQRAYSVVGQGMVENFLNTTPAERKAFFDEATGVKMYQLKKHEASNKLNNAKNNLEQAESLLNEIEPRMKSLTRQIKKLEQRTQIENDLHETQKNYYAYLWHNWNKQLTEINKKVIYHEEKQRDIAKSLQKFNEELTSYERNQYNNTTREKLEEEQYKLRAQRDVLSQDLAEARAQKNINLEIAGKSDEVWLDKKLNELSNKTKYLQMQLASVQDEEKSIKQKIANVHGEEQKINKHLAGLRSSIINYHSDDARGVGDVVDKIRILVKEIIALHDNIHNDLKDDVKVGVIKKQLALLRSKIDNIQSLTSAKQAHSKEDLQKINEDIVKWEDKKNTSTNNYITLQSEWAAIQNNVIRIKQELTDTQAEVIEITKKLKQKQSTHSGNHKNVDGIIKDLADKIIHIDHKISDISAQIKKQYDEEKKQRDIIIVLQKKAHAAQDEYNAATNALSELQVEKARVETKMEDLENEVRREMRNLREVMDCIDYHQVDVAQAQSDIQKYKKQLDLIGGIDPEIQKEYIETKERFDFLQKQSVDLRSAINALAKVIITLDKTITEKFDKRFVEIAKQFEKYFKILFDGGSVKLDKILEAEQKNTDNNEDDAHALDKETEIEVKSEPEKNKKIELRAVKKIFTGIDVRACPPNKKIKHISSLSGGERALTSIALIAAIIAVNPSPFVMLDEVDAALDEANSTRLATILEDLSKKTQFIAITHNRTIMYKADIIYGVTMGDDGVSRLLSVKVEDVNGARR